MKNRPSAHRRFDPGFTLIELLVVIAIIGILAAMLLPALAAAKKYAYVTRAKSEISGIMTAIQSYDSAYGRFPVSSTAQTIAANNPQNGDFTYGGTFATPSGTVQVGTPVASLGGMAMTNDEVISILMDFTNYPSSGNASVNLNHVKNPQQTRFLGVSLSGSTTLPGVGPDLVYRDPWLHPYVISMDLNFDEQCQDSFYCNQGVSQSTSSQPSGYNGLVNNVDTGGNGNHYQLHGKVMVWSAGPDGKVDPTKPAKAGANKDNILSWQ